jgi:hypothetical protein
MATEEHELLVAVNVSVDGSQKMAGFEVSINGRFWVSTEAYAGDSLLTHEDACDFAGLSFASVLQAGIIRYARGNRAGEGRIMVAASLTETQARIIVDDWGFFDTDLHVDVFGNVGSTSKLFEQRDINAATLLAYLWVTAS